MNRKREQAILPLLLSQLRLPTINRQWEGAAQEAASKGWSHPQYLATLCEQEIAERDRRRLSKRMFEAQLPKGKGLEAYDFSAVKGVTKERIAGLASGEVWLKGGVNVLIFGPSGTGKTHLAAAIGENIVQHGGKVLFSRTTELVQKLQAAKQSLTLPSALDRLDRYDCLILDDFGYVQRDDCETNVLFELICERYERRSMLITCNQPFSDWEHIFVNKQMAVAAIDRLVHNAIILEIDAESYRKKQAIARSERDKKGDKQL
jgi:DNA replication protein DnaC